MAAGRPCTQPTDADGYFYPFVWPNKLSWAAILENKWTLADVEKEFRGQIELALKKIPRISYISAHMGCTNMDKQVTELTDRLTKEYKIHIDMTQVKYTGYDGPHGTLEEKTQFLRMLDKLKTRRDLPVRRPSWPRLPQSCGPSITSTMNM